MSVIENAVNWAVGIASDDSHGYSQYNRWGSPDYDCSSLVITAYEQAGVPVKANGATYTGDMYRVFTKCGFKVVKLSDRRRGDVLLAHNAKTGNGHTAIYIGNEQIVHASSDENGHIGQNAKAGDQTGREICVRSYYNKPWDYCLRYTGEAVIKGDNTVTIEMTVCKKGSKVPNVGLLQTLLNNFGYMGSNGRALEIDDSFGSNTEYAVRAFQRDRGLEVDGVVGKASWGALLGSNYKR